MTSDNDLKAKLSRLLRVRGEILREGEMVPVELDAKIEEVIGQIEAGRQTTVMGKDQTQRQITTIPLDQA